MFAVVVTLSIRPADWAQFLPLLQANARAAMSEVGCSYFDICTDDTRPNEVFIYELYDDAAAFEAHLQTPHFIAFDAAVRDMVTLRDVRTFDQVEAFHTPAQL